MFHDTLSMMKLSQKLWLFTILTLIIPAVIIAVYSGWLVYVNSERSQYRYLDSIFSKIESDFTEIEKLYLNESKTIAETGYVKDKLYVYSKYWDKIQPATLEFDLVPLDDFLKQTSASSDFEIIALYRKNNNTFSKVISYGRSQYIPETLYEGLKEQAVDTPIYNRFSDGIYLQVLHRVSSGNRIVGTVLLQKGYTDTFFSQYVSQFNVQIAIISKNLLLYNSNPSADTEILENVIQKDRSQFVISAGSNDYFASRKQFSLSDQVSGTIILYSNAEEFQSMAWELVGRILIIALGCVLIPVITFLIWGSRLIAAIKDLAKGTTRISKGDLEYSVEIRGGDEFGVLQQNFNAMISALKEGRAVLEESNEELQLKNSYIDAVFQSLLINIIVLDEQLAIQVVSKSAESKLALPPNLVGSELFSIELFKDQERLLRTNIDHAWKEGAFARLSSVPLGTSSYEIDLYPVRDNGEGVTAIVLVLLNITERIRMERALMRSDRLASVGQVAAGIAHEINNPMSVILNHVQLLQSHSLTEEESDVFMSRISSEIKRVAGLIERLLQFSREEQDAEETAFPGEVLQDVLCLFAPQQEELDDTGTPCTVEENAYNAGRWTVQHKKRIIHVCLTDSGTIYPVSCGKDSIKQIFFNIFKNALEAINHDFGMIHVHIQYSREETIIRISDNGKGLPDGSSGSIFDPFYSQKSGSGTGLGLSLCQTIMERIGGSITAHSNNNRGTVVNLVFPGVEE